MDFDSLFDCVALADDSIKAFEKKTNWNPSLTTIEDFKFISNQLSCIASILYQRIGVLVASKGFRDVSKP